MPDGGLVVLASIGSAVVAKSDTPKDKSDTVIALSDSLNVSILGVGCSPFKIQRVSTRDRVSYAK